MVCRIVNKVGVQESGVWLTPSFAIRNQEKENYLITTDNCTGEAFGELFLAMTDNLSSKCFAPTDN
jgi:hypothetical protein